MGTKESLATYNRKRDFKLTPEPAGERASAGESLSFVIQKHAARQLHYDFRLELDGTLKSWAVPKGPSLDPADKRMAVHVEDHPLSYANFEGVIPPKQYGAGTVIVWDRGTWVPIGDPHQAYRDGKLKFELRGTKLQGLWALIRMRQREGERQEAWLLMKERDAHVRPASQYNVLEALPDSVNATPPPGGNGAHGGRKSGSKARPRAAVPAPTPNAQGAKGASGGRHKAAAATAPGLPQAAVPAALPLALAPQLATLVERAPPGDDWLYEIKFDGYRLLTRVDGDDVRCFTRKGNDWSAKMPNVVAAVKAFGWRQAWIDGEIVVVGADGLPDFQALQNAFDGRHTEHLQYYVFDLPYFAGYDLRAVPLAERRDVLRAALGMAPSESVHLSEAFEAEAAELMASAARLGLEGLVGKRKGAPYRSRRSADWIKLKTGLRQEFVIGGYTDPKGARTGFGSLLLGVHDAEGKLRYAGNVGTGFDEQSLRDLKQRLDKLRATTNPFADTPSDVKGHWVRPTLLAEVSFGAWTDTGRIRHAVFQGLRTDKPAVGIVREEAARLAGRAPALPAPVGKSGKPEKMEKAARTGKAVKAVKTPPSTPPGLRITHPERVVDAASGVTKAQLVGYYAAVAPLMLPHLKQRPVALLRAPSGVAAGQFFQKHAEARQFAHVELLDAALDPGHPPLLAIGSKDALLSAAQMNVIELHTWNATTRDIEKPDRIVFDLDPGEGVGWPQVQEAAQLVHAFLQELGLVAFLKTSGGKGLHVVVPITPHYGWDTVKQFSGAVVAHLAQVIPQRFVAKSGAKNRVGRLYIDFLRNGRGATTVAAWSARARPSLGVSVPVTWDELNGLTSGAQWNVSSIDARLAIGNAPWAAYASTRQGLAGAMKTLGFKPARTAA